MGTLGVGTPPKELASWPQVPYCSTEAAGKLLLIIHPAVSTEQTGPGGGQREVTHTLGSGPDSCLLLPHSIPCFLSSEESSRKHALKEPSSERLLSPAARSPLGPVSSPLTWLCYFGERVSLCYSGWPGAHHVAQDGLWVFCNPLA